MNADDTLEDFPRPRPRIPFSPSEAWIDALDQQCTESTLKTLRRYTVWLAGMFGHPDPEGYAEDLVQTTVADVASGILHWDPAAQSLEPYLIDQLRLRARREHKRATRQLQRYEHISLDMTHDDEPESSRVELEASRAVAPLMPAPFEAHPDEEQARLMNALRARTARDPMAQRFLDAIEQHAMSAKDVMRIARMTQNDYHNTRRRLVRAFEHIHGRKAKEGGS